MAIFLRFPAVSVATILKFLSLQIKIPLTQERILVSVMRFELGWRTDRKGEMKGQGLWRVALHLPWFSAV